MKQLAELMTDGNRKAFNEFFFGLAGPFEYCVARRRETKRKSMTGHQGTTATGKAGRNIITITTTRTATIHSFNFPSTTIHRDPHCPCLFFVCPEIQRLENSYISDVCDVSFFTTSPNAVWDYAYTVMLGAAQQLNKTRINNALAK